MPPGSDRWSGCRQRRGVAGLPDSTHPTMHRRLLRGRQPRAGLTRSRYGRRPAHLSDGIQPSCRARIFWEDSARQLLEGTGRSFTELSWNTGLSARLRCRPTRGACISRSSTSPSRSALAMCPISIACSAAGSATRRPRASCGDQAEAEMIPPLHNALSLCRRRYPRFSDFRTPYCAADLPPCAVRAAPTADHYAQSTALIIVRPRMGSRFPSAAPVTAAP
jgi:hypothetical protein